MPDPPAPGPNFPVGWEHMGRATGAGAALPADISQVPPWAGMDGGNPGAPAAPAAIKPTWRDPGSGAAGKRFAALSTLPAGQRLPVKRAVPLAKHLREDQAARAAAEEGPAPQPETPSSLAQRYPTPPPVAAPVALPASTDRQLGFNCPSCFAVLIIRDPAHYDGSPAPCPTCGVRIIPPRCLPDSPFTLVRPARNIPALPPPGSNPAWLGA
ncbi:MAG: hypothetical protein JWL81_538 [Verrucomicrobiales bacterium]|nr:hypothetical protein [Verrucomicrobiales bacterium]